MNEGPGGYDVVSDGGGRQLIVGLHSDDPVWVVPKHIRPVRRQVLFLQSIKQLLSAPRQTNATPPRKINK